MKLHEYIDFIRALPAGTLIKTDLLVPQFRLYHKEGLEIYYAPFEYVNPQAKVVLVGITPGFTQMEISFRVARNALLTGVSDEDEILRSVKQNASFGGTMRKNLVDMLDGIGLSTALDIPGSESLFNVNRELLHSTSVIWYPVFIEGENCTGHRPSLVRTSIFSVYITEFFRNEVIQLQDALFLPMGKSVSDVLRLFVKEGILQEEQCLLGFPHPSGANGHRKLQYERNREEFRRIVMEWSGFR